MKSFIWQICTGLHTLYSCYKRVINVKLCEGGKWLCPGGTLHQLFYRNKTSKQTAFFHYSLIPWFLE